MTEYAGYIATTPVDWSTTAREASKELRSTLADRRERREADQKETRDAIIKAADYTRSKNATINNVLMAGAQSFKSFYQSIQDETKAGIISINEKQMTLANAQANWKLLSNNLASYGDNIQQHAERVKAGIASAQEIENYKKYTKFMGMDNIKIVPSPNGDVMLQDVDTGEVISADTFSNTTNLFNDKVELNKYATDYVKSLAMMKKYDPATGLTTNVPNFTEDLEKEAIYGILTNDPNRYANVLVDNNVQYEGRGFTMSEDEAARTGKILIRQKLDNNGRYRAIIDEKYKKRAEEAVLQSIKDRIIGQETGGVSALDRAKLKAQIEKARIDANTELEKEARKADREGKKERKLLYERAYAANDLVRNGMNSRYKNEIIGKPFPYLARRKNEQGESIGEGYTVQRWEVDDKNPKRIILTVRTGELGEVDTQKIGMSVAEFQEGYNEIRNRESKDLGVKESIIDPTLLNNVLSPYRNPTKKKKPKSKKAAGDSIFK
jgi:hypothetical protein